MRQHDDREQEIRRRPGRDDRGALAQPLVVKGDLPLRRREPRQPGGRQARAGVAVAEHLDIAAERDRAELPARPGAVPPAEQLRPEADRKDFDPHPVPARDQVMAELVDKNEHGQNDDEPQ